MNPSTMDETMLRGDAPLASVVGLGLGVVEAATLDPLEPDGCGKSMPRDDDDVAGVGAPAVGGIPGAAVGATLSVEGAMTRAIIRWPASQWPGTPLRK